MCGVRSLQVISGLKCLWVFSAETYGLVPLQVTLGASAVGELGFCPDLPTKHNNKCVGFFSPSFTVERYYLRVVLICK